MQYDNILISSDKLCIQLRFSFINLRVCGIWFSKYYSPRTIALRAYDYFDLYPIVLLGQYFYISVGMTSCPVNKNIEMLVYTFLYFDFFG